jgi:hypothetical protein
VTHPLFCLYLHGIFCFHSYPSLLPMPKSNCCNNLFVFLDFYISLLNSSSSAPYETFVFVASGGPLDQLKLVHTFPTHSKQFGGGGKPKVQSCFFLWGRERERDMMMILFLSFFLSWCFYGDYKCLVVSLFVDVSFGDSLHVVLVKSHVLNPWCSLGPMWNSEVFFFLIWCSLGPMWNSKSLLLPYLMLMFF